MGQVLVLTGKSASWAAKLRDALNELRARDLYRLAMPEDLQKLHDDVSGWIYVPSLGDKDGMLPSLAEARLAFSMMSHLRFTKVLLLSSALIYGTGPGRRACVSEDYVVARGESSSVPDQWYALEILAKAGLHPTIRLTILRPVTVIPSPSLLSQRLLRLLVPALPGHDPNLQLLSLRDLAEAVRCVMESDQSGIFNVAPDDVVPFSSAVGLAGHWRLPIPRTLQRIATPSAKLDYARYAWTVSNTTMKKALNFACKDDSLSALTMFSSPGKQLRPQKHFDEHGMNSEYIEFYSKTLFRFLHDVYWRVEIRGLDNVPRLGRGILVGMHRGFMPWDGVMVLHLLARKLRRYPRFLIHPALLKFPFLSNFMTKLGGIIACQENSDAILSQGNLLGIFPEGIQAAFTKYREAYRLQPFGRDAYVKMAVRNRAPIIPFVTVGSAEIFPIYARLKSRAWTRYTGWPCFPITPTFPLLPLPLPSKWHTQFLEPIPIQDEYPAEAAQNPSVVKKISAMVRTRMQDAVNDMLARRRFVFFGSIFHTRGA